MISLDQLVAEAAAAISRLTPAAARAATAEGGLVIDIRDDGARARDGIVPASLHIPRTVLEWRVASDSPWRNPHLAGLDEQLILLCDHGYSSILAAHSLTRLGLHRATDVVGGFEAWAAAGLPVTAVPRRVSGPGVSSLPGMAGPGA